MLCKFVWGILWPYPITGFILTNAYPCSAARSVAGPSHHHRMDITCPSYGACAASPMQMLSAIFAGLQMPLLSSLIPTCLSSMIRMSWQTSVQKALVNLVSLFETSS